MAYLESAIVVYLRALYYPSGFQFPLFDVPLSILLTEIGREIATIIMLWAVAKLISNNKRQCFAFFIYNFGIWDIWYYIWLKILINWPSSLLEWDILFLIPVPWVSPVLAPILISISFIFVGWLILKYEYRNKPIPINIKDWLIEILAAFIIILSFLWETKVVIEKGIPQYYPWWLLIFAMALGLFVFFRKFKEVRK